MIRSSFTNDSELLYYLYFDEGRVLEFEGGS